MIEAYSIASLKDPFLRMIILDNAFYEKIDPKKNASDFIEHCEMSDNEDLDSWHKRILDCCNTKHYNHAKSMVILFIFIVPWMFVKKITKNAAFCLQMCCHGLPRPKTTEHTHKNKQRKNTNKMNRYT